MVASGSGEKPSASGCILKVLPVGFADGLQMGCEKKKGAKDDFKLVAGATENRISIGRHGEVAGRSRSWTYSQEFGLDLFCFIRVLLPFPVLNWGLFLHC